MMRDWKTAPFLEHLPTTDQRGDQGPKPTQNDENICGIFIGSSIPFSMNRSEVALCSVRHRVVIPVIPVIRQKTWGTAEQLCSAALALWLVMDSAAPHLSLLLCGHVDSGKTSLARHLLVELNNLLPKFPAPSLQTAEEQHRTLPL